MLAEASALAVTLVVSVNPHRASYRGFRGVQAVAEVDCQAALKFNLAIRRLIL
jgi:hypothetical protein